MIVFGITGLRSKKRLLLKIVLALLLVLALLPFLFHHYLNASAGAEGEIAPVQAEELGEGQENAVTYPGDPVRVSTDFDNFWLGLLGDSDGV